ncbi:MAG: malate dehydrogenase [Leptolyngbya sp. SIO4C1]|nr:malate dehydrogenase [Leptolyngbya sp. SIO4C1]
MASAALRNPKVTVVGAGNVGATLAQRIAYRNLAHVVLIDIIEGRPQGLALDLRESQPIEPGSYSITGTNDYADTANSDVVVVTAGLPRKPGMSRDDLVQTNGKIVIDVVRRAIAVSPQARFIIVTNPLDVMAYLAWRVSDLPSHRVMGMAGILDSARFRSFIAEALRVPAQDVQTMVLGGHGDLMVPLLSHTTVSGIPVEQLLEAAALERLVERTRNGGAEVVNHLKTGGAFYAPAASAAVMVEAIVRDRARLLPLSAHLDGQYGLSDVFLGVPCRLGCAGIEAILELQLADREQSALAASARSVQQTLQAALPLLERHPAVA